MNSLNLRWLGLGDQVYRSIRSELISSDIKSVGHLWWPTLTGLNVNGAFSHLIPWHWNRRLRVSSHVHSRRRKHFKADNPLFRWLATGLMDSLNLRWLGLGGQTVNFDLRANLISTRTGACHPKSTQVHARPGQTVSQVDPSFQLPSTCDSVWPGLNA